MTKKRRNPQAEDGEESDGDTSMEEENERMMEEEESPEDLTTSSEEDNTNNSSGPLPFLDTFYSLSSVDSSERSRAALALLNHCFFTSDKVNTKDASYALKRLFNGLCSGRAAARQGYASALTSFLKISFGNGSFTNIQKESQSDDEEEQSALQFLRSRLLKTTDPNQAESGKFGKRKKGSEERDYCFGRIFGIMSIQRSGILASSVGQGDDVQDVVAGFANDLIELYNYKKWMREPAAQGIVTLLDSFRRKKEDGKQKTHALVDYVVKEVVVPKLLLSEESDVSSDSIDQRSVLIQSYSPEQLAVAIYIQSSGDTAPFPLDEPILSSENIPVLAEALSSTSHVVHPRTHLVWEIIWSYLTASSSDQSQKRILVETCPLGNQSASEVLTELFQTVTLQSLLGQTDKPTKQGTTTHERRALALTLVKILVGGTYTSCITGPSAIDLDNDLLEKVILSPTVVQRLFLDVICAGAGQPKQGSNQHMLKPLANHVLESMEESNDVEGDDLKRRLSLAKALLMCEPRFDGRTKTKTVSNLLFFDGAERAVSATEVETMWMEYVGFLESRILSLPAQSESENSDEDEQESLQRSRSYEALGYVDLLFNAAKQILRMSSSSDKETEAAAFDTFKSSLTQRVLGFLLASAFFDCSAIESKDESLGIKAKKKKGKKKATAVKIDEMHPATLAGNRIREILASCDGSSVVPYPVRLTLSSRYFSLLADYTAMASSIKDKDAANKSAKDTKILDILLDQCQGWIDIEENGAIRHQASDSSGEEDTSKKLVTEFQNLACETRKYEEEGEEEEDLEAKAKAKCASGTALLISILYLHRLHCGKPENAFDDDDDPDADDDDDNDAEIDELISDLSEVTKSLLEQNESEEGKGQKEEEEEEEEGPNPLLGLAELCINILSSPFGSGTQSRGASSKIVRDAVKYAWIGGLNAAAYHSSTTDDNTLLDYDVMNLILGAMGAEEEEEEGEDYDEMEEDQSDMQSDNDNDEDDSSENDEGVFNAAAAEALDVEDKDADMEDNDNEKNEEDEEKELELDPNALQSLLLEDSDADLSEDDEGELEHHAGADAALAQLIKLKKDARKAGLQAKERLELTNQLRCVVLLETLVVGGPTSSYSKVLRSDVLLKTLIPMLKARKSLEKSLSSAQDIGKKAGVCVSEKRALLERMTSVLKTKICKMRLNTVQWNKSIDVVEYSSDLASKILMEVKKADDSNQSSCCSAALIMTLKSVSKPEDKVAAAAVYSEAVKEWSTKRTTRLGSSLFEDLIHQGQSLAQAALAAPVAVATVDARSPFLKSEAFRLLGGLYGTAMNDSSEQIDGIKKLGLESLIKAAPEVAKGVADSMKNDDMKKTKRIREILKSAEKLVSFATNHSISDKGFWETFQSLPLNSFATETESHGVKNACEKLATEIKAGIESVGVNKQMDVDEPKDSETPKSSGKKKKKKKKGKKR